MFKHNRFLIVGGGIGGMAAAIALSKLGIQIDLVDLDPNWRVYGAGITITGPTLRAFKALGVLEEIKLHAYTGEGIQVCRTDGTPIERLPTRMDKEVGVPGSGGIMRPTLHRILANRVRAAGVAVHLGITIESLRHESSETNVVFSDASSAAYDMVIGADGLFSRTRALIRPDSPMPAYTGQNAWRLVIPRPAAIDCRHFFLGGPYKVGLSPVSATEMYMFLLANRPRREIVPDDQLHIQLQSLLVPYEGILGTIRNQLNSNSPIVMRPLDAFFLPKPWHLSRTLLIGDAAHPTTPQLASGAGMAVEDALVLADEVGKGESVEQILAAFMARRYERCRLVVQNSLELGRLEQRGATVAEQTQLLEQSLRVLGTPI